MKPPPGAISEPSSVTIALRLEPVLGSVGVSHEAVESFCRVHGVDDAVAGVILVSLEEVLVNVVVHGNASAVDVAAELSPGRIAIRVEDDGPAFDPLRRPAPDTTLPLRDRPLGGLGIYLAGKFMNEMSYVRDGGRNCLRMVRYLEPPGTP